jgi:pimeloyl-ACP methyl ester carboxylesterase
MPMGRHRLDVNGVGLSVLELGARDGPPLLMLHGMRDVAWSLLPVAEPLAARYRLLLPELRGHGDSDQPGSYSMDHFLFDLHRVMDLLEIGSAAMFGHSLGGQVLARFAALFPERARAVVLVEGLDAREIAGRRPHLLQTLAVPQQQRPLPGIAFAAERLLANNPRLASDQALTLARQATRVDARGHLVWAFDPRVGSVFLGVSRQDTERYWRRITCPALVVSGDLADEYWRAQMPLEWNGRFAPGELAARVRLFPNAEHVAFADAGHMVHYDRPAELAGAVADFLERRL